MNINLNLSNLRAFRFCCLSDRALGDGTDGLPLHLVLVVIIKLNNICENPSQILSAQLILFLAGGKLTASNKN